MFIRLGVVSAALSSIKGYEIMWMEISIQGIGWLGTALFIISYIQLNRGEWTLKTTKYHVYNILGSVFLVINTVWDYSFAAAMANFFWGLIAVYGLLKYRTKPTRQAN